MPTIEDRGWPNLGDCREDRRQRTSNGGSPRFRLDHCGAGPTNDAKVIVGPILTMYKRDGLVCQIAGLCRCKDGVQLDVGCHHEQHIHLVDFLHNRSPAPQAATGSTLSVRQANVVRVLCRGVPGSELLMIHIRSRTKGPPARSSPTSSLSQIRAVS